MPRCEDFPCCGHGPASTGGDGGGCPDSEGRFNCVLCGRLLEKRAPSSVCGPCRTNPRAMGEMGYEDEQDNEDY